MARSYFSYSVVRADSSNLTTGGDAILTSLKDVNWSVKLVDANGDESVTAIYTGITGPTTIAGAGGTTGYNGLIEFWADAGQYVIKISDPQNRVANKNLYWDSISGQSGGIPGDFISSESLESDQIKDAEIKTIDIADSAITTAKINNLAVTTDKVNDLAITNAKIDNTTIQRTKLVTEVQNSLVPLGAIIDWFPPKSATGPDWSVPTGFAVCSGAAWSLVPNDLGYGASDGNMPNLVGKYSIGADPALTKTASGSHVTSNASQTNAGIGGPLGSNTSANMKHSHEIPAHAHGMSHWHGVADHSHGIPNKVDGASPPLYPSTTTTANAGRIPSQNSTSNASSYTGQPYLRYWNGSSWATTFDARDNTDNWSGSTVNSGPGGNADYYVDNRPASIGLLKIMKVKNV